MKENKKEKHFTLYLSNDVFEKIQKEAEKIDVSKAYIIRKALKVYFEKQ